MVRMHEIKHMIGRKASNYSLQDSFTNKIVYKSVFCPSCKVFRNTFGLFLRITLQFFETFSNHILALKVLEQLLTKAHPELCRL